MKDLFICSGNEEKHERLYSRIHRSDARREATGCSSKGLVMDVRDSSGWRAGCDV